MAAAGGGGTTLAPSAVAGAASPGPTASSAVAGPRRPPADPRLHLAEDEAGAGRADHVELAVARPEVPVEDLVAAALEVARPPRPRRSRRACAADPCGAKRRQGALHPLRVLAKVRTFALEGVDGVPVTVEVDVRRGLPAFSVVGLPDRAVRESRERVRAALANSGVQFPQQRVTVNLAPASLRKTGPSFDLAIAVAIVAADGGLPEAEHPGRRVRRALALRRDQAGPGRAVDGARGAGGGRAADAGTRRERSRGRARRTSSR